MWSWVTSQVDKRIKWLFSALLQFHSSFNSNPAVFKHIVQLAYVLLSWLYCCALKHFWVLEVLAVYECVLCVKWWAGTLVLNWIKLDQTESREPFLRLYVMPISLRFLYVTTKPSEEFDTFVPLFRLLSDKWPLKHCFTTVPLLSHRFYQKVVYFEFLFCFVCVLYCFIELFRGLWVLVLLLYVVFCFYVLRTEILSIACV